MRRSSGGSFFAVSFPEVEVMLVTIAKLFNGRRIV